MPSPNRQKNFPPFSRVLLSLVLFGLPFLCISQAVAYFEPVETSTCKSGTCTVAIPEFLNSSSSTQLKTGSLNIGPFDAATCTGGTTSGCAKLCLNPVKAYLGAPLAADAPVATDTKAALPSDVPGCVMSWQAVVSALTYTLSGTHGVYVNAFPINQVPPAGDTNPNIGEISSQALLLAPGGNTSGSGQLISLITTAQGSTTSAIYADAITSANYAALFGGTVLIDGKPVVGGSVAAKLCLGSGAGNCITSFSDISAGQDTAIIPLQDLRATKPFITYSQGAAVVGGILMTDTLVGAAPSASIPVGYNGIVVSCGDGICTSAIENHTSCPIDCR